MSEGLLAICGDVQRLIYPLDSVAPPSTFLERPLSSFVTDSLYRSPRADVKFTVGKVSLTEANLSLADLFAGVIGPNLIFSRGHMY